MQQAAEPLRDGAPATDQAAGVYRHLVRLRLVSARMVGLQRSDKLAFHSSSIGEESAIVGATLAARDGDWVFPGVREWGAALVRGLPLAAYVHQAFGTAADTAKGHATPDHPSSRRARVAPASGVLGAHLPQAVGCAWAAKIKKEDVVALALFGEDVTTSGDFHNAMNFAGVFRAPVVLVCRTRGAGKAVERANAYGVASAHVDGADVMAVVAEVRAAVARAAEGKGATLVEVVTRPATELTDGTVLALGAEDPLARLRASVADADAIDAEVRAEIETAVAAAERAGAPPVRSIFEDVYAEVPAHLLAQAEEATSWRR
jgi:pyruvate dehydrogenase E1 component alpha subunit